MAQTTLQNTLQMMALLENKKAQEAASAMQQAQQQPINRRMINPGQTPMQALGLLGGREDQTDIQNRALLDMGLGLLEGGYEGGAGVGLSRGVQRGLATADALREGKRDSAVERHRMAMEAAQDQRDMLLNMRNERLNRSQLRNTQIIEDEEGNRFYAAMQTDDTGSTRVVYEPLSPGGPEEPIGKTAIVSNGMTPQQRADMEVSTATAAARQRMVTEMVNESRIQFNSAYSGVKEIDNALAALDRGAKTGLVSSILPVLDEATSSLRRARERLGLAVVGATTFGALSEKELMLALSVGGIDDKLPPSELRKALKEKREAMLKLMAELRKATDYLESDPSHTIGGYMDMMMEQGKLVMPSAEPSQSYLDKIKSFEEGED